MPEAREASLMGLHEMLASLERDAAGLAREIDTESANGSFDKDASAARVALADAVVPLSAKDGVSGELDLYMEGLRRRRHRLQREGAVLSEQLAGLSAETARLRAERARLTEHVASLRQHGAEALTRLDDVHAHRRRTIAWAAVSAAQRERLLAWSERLAVHTRRLRDIRAPR